VDRGRGGGSSGLALVRARVDTDEIGKSKVAKKKKKKKERVQSGVGASLESRLWVNGQRGMNRASRCSGPGRPPPPARETAFPRVVKREGGRGGTAQHNGLRRPSTSLVSRRLYGVGESSSLPLPDLQPACMAHTTPPHHTRGRRPLWRGTLALATHPPRTAR
jgi:hypothetical protein